MRVLLAAVASAGLGLVGWVGDGVPDAPTGLVHAPRTALGRASQRVAPPTRRRQKPTTRKKNGKGSLSVKESAALRGRARHAMKAGDLERATRLLRRAAGVKKRSERLAWLLIEAELECAKKHYARGGLAAMRVVILHSRSEHVPAALYWAGRSYEGLKRPRQAAELYRECLAHKRMPASVRTLAKARRSALKKQASER